MSKFRETVIFFILSLAFCWAVFGDAMTGKSLLAPVDIAPANWEEFRFVDPNTDGLCTNHYSIDQLWYDLPLQWTVYKAYRRGEIPWWDPYTFSGRPLLADAHVSAADPVRIACFLLIPRFELAYNWLLITHYLIGGITFFSLLRFFGIRPLIAGGIGLAGMFSAYNSVLIGYPWLQGSFIYYPILWMAWHRLWLKPSRSAIIVAVLACTLILYVGNLQSHSYLVLFATAFVAGYAKWSFAGWKRGLLIVAPIGLAAGLIAAPVLWPEVQLLMLSVRSANMPVVTPAWWDGLASMLAVWPWALGTFRTLNYQFFSFYPFIGTAALMLACVGARACKTNNPLSDGDGVRRCAVLLVVGYLILMTVPTLNGIFYFRVAGLVVLGLLVLAAMGAERIAGEQSTHRRFSLFILSFACAAVIGTVLVVTIVYPKVKPRVQAIADSRTTDETIIRSKALRQRQVDSYPQEIAFSNPEVLVNWLGLVALAGAAGLPQWRRYALPLALLLNLGSLVLLARRSIARAPVSMWERLLAGGPTQTTLQARLNPQFLRLAEKTVLPLGNPFCRQFAHFYGVHVTDGYAALMPRNFFISPQEDWEHFADLQNTSDGGITARKADPPARFQWLGEQPRTVRVISESLNTIEVDLGDGPAGWLRRSDTPYPGWTGQIRGAGATNIRSSGDLFTEIAVPAGPARLILRYQPNGLPIALAASLVGILGLGAVALTGGRYFQNGIVTKHSLTASRSLRGRHLPAQTFDAGR